MDKKEAIRILCESLNDLRNTLYGYYLKEIKEIDSKTLCDKILALSMAVDALEANIN